MDELESEWENKESSTGKLGWRMRLGRKLLVTGIVMSSAPIVIPSIMVISTIGLVCSVPYGVLLATYACTKTLMSRLLPIPSPDAPLLLEYDKAFNGEEEEELREGRIEFVDKGYEELDTGGILREGEYQEYGVENYGKELVEQVGEIVEEDNGEFMHERPSESFEEVEQINGLQVEQPIIEESRDEQSRDEGDEKCSSNIEKETPVGSENVEEKKEVVREMQPSVEIVDAPKKRRKKKSKSKSEGTTKGKGEQSVEGSASEQQGDKKGRDNEIKQKTGELKNIAVDVANEELVRNSRGSLERNGKEAMSRDAAEGEKGVEKEQVGVVAKKSKGDEGTRRKRGQCLIEESLAKQPVDDKVVDAFGGLEGSEKKEKEHHLIEESLAKQPVDDKVIGALGGLEGSEKDKEQLLIEESLAKQPVDDKVLGALGGTEGSEKKEKEQHLIEESLAKQPVGDKVIGALGGLEGSEKKDKEQRLIEESLSQQPVDDKVIGGLEGSEKDKKAPLDGSVSEQLMEEVCSIMIEFEGDEKNDNNMENKTPFQVEKVDVHISQSTDTEEDKELVRDTRGLLEKIRDEGKSGYVDDKPSTENSSTVSLQGSSPGVNTEESRPSSSCSVHQEASDSSELPVSMKALEADDVRISADNVIDASSDEAMQCEERIWEQMNSLRTIVGYKAARKETCKEELKALYLFTGIEPPASLKETCCDLAEVNAKLGFLKSVVGVK